MLHILLHAECSCWQLVLGLMIWQWLCCHCTIVRIHHCTSTFDPYSPYEPQPHIPFAPPARLWRTSWTDMMLHAPPTKWMEIQCPCLTLELH